MGVQSQFRYSVEWYRGSYDVDIDSCFGCFCEASMSVNVLWNGIEANMVLTLTILKSWHSQDLHELWELRLSI